MIREAFVAGINLYPFLKDSTGKVFPLLKAAEDAEPVAQILETCGNFRVRRLPEIYLGETRRVDNKQQPIFYNCRKEIILIGQKPIIYKSILNNQIYPYKGLE